MVQGFSISSSGHIFSRCGKQHSPGGEVIWTVCIVMRFVLLVCIVLVVCVVLSIVCTVLFTSVWRWMCVVLLVVVVLILRVVILSWLWLMIVDPHLGQLLVVPGKCLVWSRTTVIWIDTSAVRSLVHHLFSQNLGLEQNV